MTPTNARSSYRWTTTPASHGERCSPTLPGAVQPNAVPSPFGSIDVLGRPLGLRNNNRRAGRFALGKTDLRQFIFASEEHRCILVWSALTFLPASTPNHGLKKSDGSSTRWGSFPRVFLDSKCFLIRFNQNFVHLSFDAERPVRLLDTSVFRFNMKHRTGRHEGHFKPAQKYSCPCKS